MQGPPRRAPSDRSYGHLRDHAAAGVLVAVALLIAERPLLQGQDDLRHLHNGIWVLFQLVGPIDIGRVDVPAVHGDLEKGVPRLGPAYHEVRCLADEGIVGQEAVGDQVLDPQSLAQVPGALELIDRRLADLPRRRRQEQVAFQRYATLLNGLPGDHERRYAPLGVDEAVAEKGIPFTPGLGIEGLYLAQRPHVLRGAVGRIQVGVVDEAPASPLTTESADDIIPARDYLLLYGLEAVAPEPIGHIFPGSALEAGGAEDVPHLQSSLGQLL